MELYEIVWQEVSHIWKLYDKKFWSTREITIIFKKKLIEIWKLFDLHGQFDYNFSKPKLVVSEMHVVCYSPKLSHILVDF